MHDANQIRRPRGFRSLIPAPAWAFFAQQGIKAYHSARQRLLRQGDPGGWVLLCLAGRVQVVYAEPDGRELMVAIRGPGDVIGEFSGRDGHPRSGTVRAIEPGMTSKLSDQRFDEHVQRFGLRAHLDSYILGKLRETSAHAWQLAHHNTRARLADLILAIIDAAGPDHLRPNVIPMSQEELSSALGLVRSAITPVLADWKAAGLVRIARGQLEVVDVLVFASGAVSTSGQNRSR